MELSQQARDVMDVLHRTRRRPGARITIAHLRDDIAAADPVVGEALCELIKAGYFLAPDADAVELTGRGYAAIQLARLVGRPAGDQ